MSDNDDKEVPSKPKYGPQIQVRSDLTRKQEARMARVPTPTKRQLNRDYNYLPKGRLATD